MTIDIQLTNEQFDSAKSRQLIPIKCQHCNIIFHKSKNQVQAATKRNINGECKFLCCSLNCLHYFKGITHIMSCKQCGKTFNRANNKINTTNNFCSQSCAGKHSNANKTSGYRRSKYEEYLEQELTKQGITVVSNGRIQGHEFDLFLPQYNVAIEVNGIVHYKPIYGQDKLESIQFRDRMKVEICNSKGINLVVFDVSQYSHFKYNTHHCDTFLHHLIGAYC